MRLNIELLTKQLADFCQQHRVQKLALFGSVLRDDFTSTSDVDVLVDFEPGVEETFTLLDLAGMQIELSELLQREVDLVLSDSLKPFLRQEILASAEVIYEV